jgi:mannose-6-phosphate isomerase-like protein (cupin superfamily)
MTVVHAAEAPRFTLPGTTFTGLAAPSRGAAEVAVWRISIEVGNVGVSHQLSREEVFVAISGRGLARISGQAHAFGAGDAIVVPPFVDFALDNTGDTPLDMVVAFPVGGQAIAGGKSFTPPWAE